MNVKGQDKTDGGGFERFRQTNQRRGFHMVVGACAVRLYMFEI
jgi:hypothetical protein